MNSDILNFIQKQKTASVCTVDEEYNPYCFSCYYAFDPVNALLFYKTHGASRHASLMLKKTEVAGTILPEKSIPLVVKGVQFEGIVLSSDHPLAKEASKTYHLKYPFALTLPGVIWVIQLRHIKMTDSTKGFGAKIEWSFEEFAATHA